MTSSSYIIEISTSHRGYILGENTQSKPSLFPVYCKTRVIALVSHQVCSIASLPIQYHGKAYNRHAGPQCPFPNEAKRELQKLQ